PTFPPGPGRSGSGPCRPSARHGRRTSTTVSSASRPPERVPRTPDVVLGRALVPDREAEDVSAVQPRVGDEDLAARVDALEQRFVLLVGRVTDGAAEGGWSPA